MGQAMSVTSCPGDFVDDHVRRVLPAAASGFQRRGRNADGGGEHDQQPGSREFARVRRKSATPAATTAVPRPAIPTCPGPGRSRPAPKKVATSVAHAGLIDSWRPISVGLFDRLIGIGGVVDLGIVQRSGNDIGAARPLAEVDEAAAVAAETGSRDRWPARSFGRSDNAG